MAVCKAVLAATAIAFILAACGGGNDGASEVTAIAAGPANACALTGDGQAICWGAISMGTTETFTAISPGLHTCAITTKGGVKCWGGHNVHGQLGDGTRSRRVAPVLAAGGQAFETISAGVSHTCGFTTDGRALCWGANNRGQLGTGATSERVLRPAEVTVVPGNSP